MPGKHYTPEELARVRRWYADGVPVKVIAASIGRAPHAVHNLRQFLRLPARVRKESRAAWEPALREAHARGESDRWIARRLHCSANLARKRRNRLGLPANRDTSPSDVVSKGAATAARRNGPSGRMAEYVQRLKAEALAAGWPGACGTAQVRVLDALAAHGPATCPGLAALLPGLHQKTVSRALRRLRSAGLVLRHARGVREPYRYAVTEPHLSRWREVHHSEIKEAV